MASILAMLVPACTTTPPAPPEVGPGDDGEAPVPGAQATESHLRGLIQIRLEPDIAHLTPRQRQMLDRLIEAAAEMDRIFRIQGGAESVAMAAGADDPAQHHAVQLNYGPWDRFRGNRPILVGTGPKPAGAGFYPPDMSREEFESVHMPGKWQRHTVVRRAPNGGLLVVPYREAFRTPLEKAARRMAQAAGVCDDPEFKRYLTLRARALITDDYAPSDQAWMELDDNTVDLVIGPTAGDEDGLFGYKSAYAAWVLLRDRGRSNRLSHLAAGLPEIRQSLPVTPLYRGSAPVPAAAPALYEAVLLAGAANAGPKKGVVDMPLEDGGTHSSGSRRLILRNVMQARFEHFILPAGAEMLVPDQRDRISFDALLDNALAAGLAQGLGPQDTIDGRGSVREALADRFTEIDDARADVLGMYILGWDQDQRQAGPVDLADHYVTFVAGMFWDMHREPTGSRRAMQLNFLKAYGAVSRDRSGGRYRVHVDRMREALGSLAAQLLVIAGNGDYRGAGRLIQDMGEIGPELQEDLARLGRLDLPVGMIFRQGVEASGIQ